MALKNRVGFFFIFCGGIALLFFGASLKFTQAIDVPALLIGLASLLVGWALATSKRRPAPAAPAEACPPPPAPPKRRGVSLFRKPPPPPPPAPPPPVKKKARRGLFRSQ